METNSQTVSPDVHVDFDVFDPGLTMPVDTFQEQVADMAATAPVVRSTAYGGHWIVTQYQEVAEVLRDPELFSSYPNNLVPHGFGVFIPLELDPPVHTAYRHLLQPLFNPARMRALEPQLRAIVTELIDQFANRGHGEFIADFAHELPARAFLALMGWPLDDAPMFTVATDTTLRGVPGGTEEESAQARAEAAGQMLGYFANVIAERRSAAFDPDDITSLIMHSEIEIDGTRRKLTDDELSNMFMLLLIAGLHTTQGSLAWTVMYLAANPIQRQKLIDNPDGIPNAIEEILRIEGAVSPGRRVTRDTTLAGVPLKAGDQLLVLLSGANRDHREFPNPNDVEIDRSPNRHLSFGAGPHRCLGSHLARIELRIALEELIRRLPDIAPEPDRLPVINSAQVRGIMELFVRFTPEQQ
ncbi:MULTISPECIES: cytochrome P450 [unclassified Mycolicibacterium]|uniref:cytochrome P450 n=1 Tax=unclassified Mycolicibacterium TaxID=2636767 RepID=UPI0012DFC30D|nr:MULTISPECIES: cytochrome P450 [unclassified Mycolicibacterium]MUL82315.1 cytochrome P450 [Mycolicibacterium sp. CBMA 329]MUL88081.1 cytochrome P450 [Mycolicibacterium sp. CBMA 331]MUM02411.1 cytochrome P450 [Mycolicibacterium sp. CBMA 334]MUM24814.1 cytochrome P450 [Mycolicibacterium sp. CBMA 295]MUM38378.1 cytochrome P450 [Mycolicibacterium sp. CBMA 247]